MNCGARLSPSMVRHGLNHSHPAVSVPARVCMPSEITMISFIENSEGSSDL